jgi:uncharacterized protein
MPKIPPLQVALIHACKDGEVARVAKALEEGAKLEYVAEDSAGIQRPLFIAATYGHTKLFRFLLDRGADVRKPTSTGETVLVEAAKHDHVDIVAMCLEAGVEQDGLLDAAIGSGAARTVQYLLVRGATPHANALHRAASMPPSSYERGDASTIVQALLDAGADLHAKDDHGCTLFQLASKNDNVPNSWLAYLCDLGARIDEPDAWGMTALWTAARCNRTQRVIWLLSRHANANAKTTRDSALAKANTSVYDIAKPTADLDLLSALRDAGAQFATQQAPVTLDPFRVGASVSHPKFGTGKIIARDGIGDGLKLTIEFAGEKKILLAKFVSAVA